MPVALVDAADALVFAATISVILFTVQYTLTSPWWNDSVGRTVIAKDLGLLVLLVPSSLVLIWPHLLTPLEGMLVTIGSVAVITGSMLWRCVVWYRIKRPWPFPERKARADKDT